MAGSTSLHLQLCLDRLRAGDVSAHAELLRHSKERLEILARRMLSRYPKVRRWEDTDDIYQLLYFKLERLLKQVTVTTPRDFFRLSATNLRRLLIDRARRYQGPEGHAANHYTPINDPHDSSKSLVVDPADTITEEASVLIAWETFHQEVEKLPPMEAEVFDLIWYNGLTQEEAAEILEVSVMTVRRYWQRARLRLMEAFGGESPF